MYLIFIRSSNVKYDEVNWYIIYASIYVSYEFQISQKLPYERFNKSIFYKLRQLQWWMLYKTAATTDHLAYKATQ